MKNRQDFFRADVIKRGIINLAENREVIMGVAVVTKGVTHDDRGEFDAASLDKVVELGNAAKFGIKSRYGHPNMSSTALGTFLGRFRGFFRDGDVVRADLFIDPSAHNTPDGDLAQYVIDLAKSDPDAFGTSMVIKCSFEDRNKDEEKGKDAELKNSDASVTVTMNGTSTNLTTTSNSCGDGGEEQVPLIVVKELFAVDVVDQPAANNSFFGKRFFSESVMLSAEMTEILDNFLNHPDGIEQAMTFLKRYQFNKSTSSKEANDIVKNSAMDVQFEAPVNINKCYVKKGVGADPGSGDWIVEGLAATVDLDLQDEIISDEALAKSENDLLENSTVLFNHDINTAVGRVLKTEKRDEGLWVQILVSKTVPDVWQQIQEGVLNKFSIRGRVIEAVRQFMKEANKTVRVIKEMLLVEVSLVPLPANPKAKAMNWFVQKALDDYESKGGEVPMDPKTKDKKQEELEAKKNAEGEGEGTDAGAGQAAAGEGAGDAGAAGAGEGAGAGEQETKTGEGEAEAGAEKKYSKAELDEAVNKAVEKAIADERKKASKEIGTLSDKVDDLQRRLDESEADSTVEKLWNEKYSSMYKDEDAAEIKPLLKKMQLGQALTQEEMNVMIEKKEMQDESLPNSSETITSKGMTEERKEELRKLGGIKPQKK